MGAFEDMHGGWYRMPERYGEQLVAGQRAGLFRPVHVAVFHAYAARLFKGDPPPLWADLTIEQLRAETPYGTTALKAARWDLIAAGVFDVVVPPARKRAPRIAIQADVSRWSADALRDSAAANRESRSNGRGGGHSNGRGGGHSRGRQTGVGWSHGRPSDGHTGGHSIRRDQHGAANAAPVGAPPPSAEGGHPAPGTRAAAVHPSTEASTSQSLARPRIVGGEGATAAKLDAYLRGREAEKAQGHDAAGATSVGRTGR